MQIYFHYHTPQCMFRKWPIKLRLKVTSPPVFAELTLQLPTLSYLNTKALSLSEDLHKCGGYRYAILSDSHNTAILTLFVSYYGMETTVNTANVSYCRVCTSPANLWACVRVACTVALGPRQRCTEIVGVGLVINGAEDQPRLVT